MKLLIAIKTLSYSVGGAEKLVSFLSGALSDKAHDVHLLTFDKHSDVPFFPISEKITKHFVSTLSSSEKTRWTEFPKLLITLRAEVKKIKPDVVIAFMHSTFVPLQIALLGTGIKVVLSEHTVPSYYDSRKLEFWALCVTSIFARSITIVSEKIRDLYPAVMSRKMTILPNPVLSDFQPALGNTKNILTVGRLNRDKDHQVLIEAFALLPKRFADWTLTIVGEGEERPALEKIVRDLRLEDRVFLSGTRNDLDNVYKAADIFIIPSRYESFGMATIEAMSHSLPVIGFADCSGTNELIQDGENGFLVEHRSAQDLSKAIVSLLESKDMRNVFGNNSFMRSQKFSSETVVSLWEKYINNL